MVKFQVFEKRQGELTYGWYWHCKSENGKITFDGAEGYSSAGNAIRAIRRNVLQTFNCLEAMPIEILDTNGKVVRDLYA